MCRFLKFYMWNNPLMEVIIIIGFFVVTSKPILKWNPFWRWSIIKTLQFCSKIFWSTYQALPLIRTQHSLSENLCTKLPLQFKFPTGSHNKGHHMAQVGGMLNLRFDWYISLPPKNISDLVYKKIIRIRFSGTGNLGWHVGLPRMQNVAIFLHVANCTTWVVMSTYPECNM